MMEMQKVLFLGGAFPKDSQEIESNSIGNIQYAANTLQWNIINGILEDENVELTVSSAVFVGSWPKRYKKLRIKREKNIIEANISFESIPFLNFPVWKNISRYYNICRYVEKWIKKNLKSNYKLCIIAYSAHTPFIKVLHKMKKKYNVNTHLIVPDLPEYMNLGNRTSFLYSLLKKTDIAIQKKNIDGIDSFTFLTYYMNEIMNIYNKPFTVVEGMVDSKEAIVKEKIAKNTENINILYTGTMNERYGVLKLVQAMEYIQDQRVNLILCGTGDSDNKIREAAKKDARIKYMGQVSRKKALEYQSQATVLVNPRSNNEEYTKYSFPSKNLEFMLHHKPVIVFKLKGIPDDYDEILCYFRSEQPEQMAEDIMKICYLSKEERNEIGEKVTEFAVNQKNYVVQTRKILTLCRQVMER